MLLVLPTPAPPTLRTTVVSKRMCWNWGCLVWFCLRCRSRVAGTIRLHQFHAYYVLCVRTGCVCVFTIFAQMLPVPRNKAKYFLENLLPGTSCTRSTSALSTADTASTRSISSFCIADTFGLAVVRGSIVWILPVLQVFRASALRVLQVLAVFRPLVALVLRVITVVLH